MEVGEGGFEEACEGGLLVSWVYTYVGEVWIGQELGLPERS